MPAIAAITLLNGESTPVSHTFYPLGQDSKTGIWWFEDRSPRVPASASIGFPRIGVRTKREMEVVAGQSAKSTVARVELTIALPQLETLGSSSSGFTPAPTVAYVDRVQISYILSSRDALLDRKDALAFSKNLLNNALIVDLIESVSSLF